METKVKLRVRANVTFYDNDDVDIRIPQENDALKLEKVKETKCGSLTRTQGKQPLLQLRVKTRADVPDPAASLREECARLLKELDKNDGNLTKISTKSKGRWLRRDDDLKIRADTENGFLQIAMVLPLEEALKINERLNQKISDIYSCLVTQRVLLSRLANAAKQPTEK